MIYNISPLGYGQQPQGFPPTSQYGGVPGGQPGYPQQDGYGGYQPRPGGPGMQPGPAMQPPQQKRLDPDQMPSPVSSYRKVPKFSDARKLCCNLPKIQTKSPNLRVFRQKDA